jgi:hypothetical protein
MNLYIVLETINIFEDVLRIVSNIVTGITFLILPMPQVVDKYCSYDQHGVIIIAYAALQPQERHCQRGSVGNIFVVIML